MKHLLEVLLLFLSNCYALLAAFSITSRTFFVTDSFIILYRRSKGLLTAFAKTHRPLECPTLTSNHDLQILFVSVKFNWASQSDPTWPITWIGVVWDLSCASLHARAYASACKTLPLLTSSEMFSKFSEYCSFYPSKYKLITFLF